MIKIASGINFTVVAAVHEPRTTRDATDVHQRDPANDDDDHRRVHRLP